MYEMNNFFKNKQIKNMMSVEIFDVIYKINTK